MLSTKTLPSTTATTREGRGRVLNSTAVLPSGALVQLQLQLQQRVTENMLKWTLLPNHRMVSTRCGVRHCTATEERRTYYLTGWNLVLTAYAIFDGHTFSEQSTISFNWIFSNLLNAIQVPFLRPPPLPLRTLRPRKVTSRRANRALNLKRYNANLFGTICDFYIIEYTEFNDYFGWYLFWNAYRQYLELFSLIYLFWCVEVIFYFVPLFPEEFSFQYLDDYFCYIFSSLYSRL